MTERHLRKCSTSLVIRETQIKTILGFHFTPLRMTKIKNTDNHLCWRGCGEKGTLLHCWWECKLVQTFWMLVWWILTKLGNNLFQDPVTPLLGIYPKDAQSCHKDMYSTIFIAELFVIARTWKQPKCPLTKERISKMWYIYTAEKKITSCKWQMDEARKHYFDWGNPDTERQLSHVLTHRWFLNIKQRKSVYKPQSQKLRQQCGH